MIKYIKVEWPEMQKFQDLPNYEDECYEHESGIATFVPENLYNEVMNPPFKIPDEYKDKFEMFPISIKRGQNVLIIMNDTRELRVVKAATSWKASNNFPLILENLTLLEGLDYEIIGVEKEGIQNED